MRKLLINRWLHTLILLFLLGMAIVVRAHDYDWAKSLRFRAFDTYNKLYKRSPTDEVVIVDIDESSMARPELGQWPWSRLAIARLVENLEEMGAASIAFDMVFPEADRTSPQAILDRMMSDAGADTLRRVLETMPDNDDVLAKTFQEAGNVVTGFIWTNTRTEITSKKPKLSQQILMKKPARVLLDDGDDDDRNDPIKAMIGVVNSIPILSNAAAGNGGFGVIPEVDGIIRRVPMLFIYEDATGARTLYPSLAIEAIRVAIDPKMPIKIRTLDNPGIFDAPLMMEIGEYDVPMDWDGSLTAYFSKKRPEEYIPAWKIIENEIDPASIRGKIVFVGTSAEGLKDLRSTPLDLFIPGVELHVNVVEQILTNTYLHRPNILEGVELLSIGLVGLIIILLSPFIGVLYMAAFTLTLVGVIAFTSWYGYVTHGLLFDPVYPSLCILVLFMVSSLLSYIRTEAERRQVREAFGLYISPDFMAELTKDPDKLRLGGETRELTVMFSDIRNFTSIAETMSPEALIQLMNDFLTPMSDLVMSNRGTIDKYMGDAMMAFWNAPLDDPHHARHACMAALQMNTALKPINEGLKIRAQSERRPPTLLKAGIGISTGPASVGNIGSKQRFAYSAIGDTVNLASRLEGQTKYYSASILISQETQKQVPDFATLELDLLRVKGKQEPIRVYALLGDENYAAPQTFHHWHKKHEEMLMAYRAGKFIEAERLIQECQNQADPRLQNFYALYLQRISVLKETPPAEGWDGVYTAAEK